MRYDCGFAPRPADRGFTELAVPCPARKVGGREVYWKERRQVWGVTARGGGEVEVLLNTPVDLPLRLWVGSEPTRIALPAADLESFGALGFQEQSPGAALIRALVGTGAELVVVEPEELPSGGRGVGAAAVHRSGGAAVTPRRPAGAAAAGSARCWEELVGYV